MKKDSSNINIERKSTYTKLLVDGEMYMTIYSFTSKDIESQVENFKGNSKNRRMRLKHPIAAIIEQGGMKMEVNGKTVNICGRSMFYCNTGTVIDLIQITSDSKLKIMSL